MTEKAVETLPKTVDPGRPEDADDTASRDRSRQESKPKEIGGRGGPDPTRYGDWEKNGRCIDF